MAPCGKKTTSGRLLGGSQGGLRGAGSPPLWGSGQRPEKFFFGPYIRLGEPTYGFRSMVLDLMVFRSMVLDASACKNMYCNIERNIMKNQAGSLGFGIQWEISVYMCFMCYSLALFIFLCFRIRM